MTKDKPKAGEQPPKSGAFAPEVTLLKWSSSLMRRKPKTFLAGVAATLVGLVLIWFAFGSAIYVVLAVLLLGGALAPVYFPQGFVLTNKKACQVVFFSREGFRWQDFDEYRLFDDGVYLHLRPTDMRMRYLKGLMLYFGPSNREQVLDLIRQRIGTLDHPAGQT